MSDTDQKIHAIIAEAIKPWMHSQDHAAGLAAGDAMIALRNNKFDIFEIPGPLITLPDTATFAVGKWTIWLYNLEGWKPNEFDTLAECFDYMCSIGHCGGYRITRDVDVEIREKGTGRA